MCVQMDHPNIIKLIETYEDETAIYLVMELCEGGELYDRLQAQHQSRFPEPVAAQLVMKMLSSVAYCHRKNISHRDLKSVWVSFVLVAGSQTYRRLRLFMWCHRAYVCMGMPGLRILCLKTNQWVPT